MSKVQTKERKIKLQIKHGTIVTLDPKTHAVPKRKARDKLVEDGRVQELLIGMNESETEVCRKIQEKMSKFLGERSFQYMAVSSSSDIIPAEFPDQNPPPVPVHSRQNPPPVSVHSRQNPPPAVAAEQEGLRGL